MKQRIQETIVNILDQDRNLINSSRRESYIFYPEEGKVLLNKKTGLRIETSVCFADKLAIRDYDEVDK